MNSIVKWAICVSALLSLIQNSKTTTLKDTGGLKNIMLQDRSISPASNELNLTTQNRDLPPAKILEKIKMVMRRIQKMRIPQNLSGSNEGLLGEDSCEWKEELEEFCRISVGALCGPGVQLITYLCVCSNRPASEQHCLHVFQNKHGRHQECYVDCKEPDYIIFSVIIFTIIWITLLLLRIAYNQRTVPKSGGDDSANSPSDQIKF